MKTRKQSVRRIPTFPAGYRPSRKAQQYEERPGVKQWLIRAAKNDREVVVVDAVSEDEALQRTHQVSETLKALGVWPKLPVIYAEEHTGPVSISWFREGAFRAIADREATAS